MYQIKGTAFLTTWTWLCRSPCAPVAVIFFSLFQCPGIAPFPFPGFGKRLINCMFCVKKPTSGDIAAGEEMKSLKPGAGKKGTSQHPLSSPMQIVRKTVTELWPLLQILPLAMYRHQDRRAAQRTKEPEKAPSGWDDTKSLATWPKSTWGGCPLLLASFPFLMTMSRYFQGWSCCTAGSQRVKMENGLCTFKITCDKVHCLKSGSLLPLTPPQFPAIIYYKGVLWYKFDNLPYTLALF